MERLTGAKVNAAPEAVRTFERRVHPYVSVKPHWDSPLRTASILGDPASPKEVIEVQSFLAEHGRPFKEHKPLSKRAVNWIIAAIATIIGWALVWENWADIANDIFGP